MALLVVVAGVASGLTGCATTDQMFAGPAPDPAYYQSSDNPYHSD